MKKSLILVICAIFLILPLASCLPSATSQPSNPVAYQTDITALKEADKNLDEGIKKVDDRVTAWADKVTAVETKIGILQAQPSANTYSKDQLYTQQQVNDAITAAIKALKDNQTWITGSTGGSTTPTATNQIAVKIYSISPSMIYSAGSYDMFVEMKNGYADAKKLVLTITMTPDNSGARVCNSCGLVAPYVYCGNPTCLPTAFSSDSAYITGTAPKMATSVSSGDCINYTNLIMGTTNQILIAGNGSILVPIKFQLTYCGNSGGGTASPTAIWSPTCSITIIP